MTAISVLVFWSHPGFADGIYRNGVGARAMAMGGADAAYAADPLGAMAANPAGLGFLTVPELDLSLNAESAYGQFTKPGQSEGPLSVAPGFFPDAAYAMRLGNTPLTAGLSFVTDSAVGSDWGYVDPKSMPGGITYGYQHDRSQIILFRSAAGIGYSPSPEWSFGANVGLVYNQNNLEAPYIFQSAPGLAGAKVLLDLNTTGFGCNGQVGALYRPMENLQFGLTYKSPTTIHTDGDAVGDAGVQLGRPAGYPFHYDAEVKNVLPQMITAGASWKFSDSWRLAVQVDWINWADAFTQLPVSLRNGTSSQPMVLPTSIDDNVPLNWRNEFVYRGGLEYGITTNLLVRAGYCYGRSPVPDATLTPLTAVIMEHTVTTGIGYNWGRYRFEMAYQWEIPVTRNIGASSLQAQEYSQSSVKVGAQTFVLSTGIRF